MKLSYLITCHNELESLDLLFKRLLEHSDDEDEIIVMDDFSDNPETKKILEKAYLANVKVVQHSLDNNYGAHKNYGNSLCTGEWIFQIDGDERPDWTLMTNIKEIIESNTDIELFYVPRINDFIGVTETDAKQWGWKLTPSPICNNRPIVNWPDYQSRIYKNVPDRIRWDRRLHEKIEGHTKWVKIPAEEDLALYHHKTMAKQLETNIRYNKMFTEAENRGHNVTS